MAADGEPQQDGAGSDNSESSGASSSSPSPSPATLSAPPPITVTAPPGSSSSSAAAAAPLPLHPHLFFQQQQQQQQQRLLSLHLSSASTPAPVPTAAPALAPAPAAAQQRPVTNAEPSPAPPPDRPFRDDCWSENATLTLIQAWGDRYLELNRGNLKQKHWKDVAHSVNSRPLTSSKPPKTDVQCKNRLDTLKKKYKIEKSKLVTGGAPSKWAFFDRLDELIGSSKKPKTPPLGKAPRAVSVAADGNCTTNPDGQCTGMSATLTVAKCAMEEDVKPPVLFIPPQATIVIPPPLISHHVGTMGAQINHHATSGPPINHHGGTPIQHVHHGVTPIHHHPGEGVHMNHLASGAAAMNHHVDDGAAADTASKSKAGQDMSQSSPPHNRPVDGKGHKRKREDSPFRDLARAISKFGEIYERVEIAKLQQMMVLEKQRMEFTKDLEIQRLQLFMQTQVELAKMRHGS